MVMFEVDKSVLCIITFYRTSAKIPCTTCFEDWYSYGCPELKCNDKLYTTVILRHKTLSDQKKEAELLVEKLSLNIL